ncbi:MAG TPA: methionine biosynthesis protein MetW [Bryobacteraceae bacterium]|nr:methionine biosynthesis protein MetW [Bryobacteraceae bacterium]
MAAGEDAESARAEEIVELAREIRERVRARYPGGSVAGVTLPDLTPVLHARDAAEAKVAAIGSVNPRPPGPLNVLIQSFKRAIARLLDWHVRDQVEFNRSTVAAIEAMMDALNENNRALSRLAAADLEARSGFRAELAAAIDECKALLASETELLRQQAEALRRKLDDLQKQSERLLEEARELKDVRAHWAEWRQEWEKKLSINEIQFLRSVADLEAGFTHRATLMEANFRDLTKTQHKDFTLAQERSSVEIQKRLWEDLERSRVEFDRLIHSELRLIRQRAAALPAGAAPAASSPPPAIDWMWFAGRFRGSAEYVKKGQRFYLPFFKECRGVLDLGCGRGEFLELMQEEGVEARGVELSDECVEVCRSKGLRVEKADLFSHLDGLSDPELDGIFLGQVVEHISPERIPELIRLAASRLSRGGLLVVETPNPECLAIFTTHFYLDPSHTRPIPPALLRFYMEESGFGGIEIHRLSPAVDSMPALASLPEDFRQAFFGGLDYAIIGRKL